MTFYRQDRRNAITEADTQILPSITEVDTKKLPSIQNGQIAFRQPRWLRLLPEPVQSPIVKLLKRASDSEVEIYLPYRYMSVNTQGAMLGWLPLLTLTCAIGLSLIAYAFTNSRDGGTELNFFFFSGVLLIFTPVAARLLAPSASRFERLGLVCVVGIGCYLIKILSSPLYFSFFDEFLHWRTADDIATSGHLFSQNALLPVSPYYPGLEIVTNALSSLSGLNTFTTGLIVIGVARLLIVLSLFALYEVIMKSSRMATIATIIYMANPHFLLFDAQYGYESLALPLAAFAMFALSPYQEISTRLNRIKPVMGFMMFAHERKKGLSRNVMGITLTTWIAVLALVFTHHVTDFFLVGLLLIWTVTFALMRLIPFVQSNVARTTLLALCVSITYTLCAGNPVVGYLSSFIGESLKELQGVVTGTGGSRQLFVTYAGQPTPLWERVMTLSSVGLIVLCLPFGLLCFWQRYRSSALTCTLAVITIFYPVSQVFRFTTTGSEITDRAAPFLFIAIAALLAIFIVQFWPIRFLNRKHFLLLTFGITLVFSGGVILGIGPSSALLPGPYQVIADARSIEPEGIQAAMWTGSHLGTGNRVASDRINQVLMGTYGNQRIVSTIEDKIDLSPVFLSQQLGPQEVALLKTATVRYLVVDMRLTQSLPLLGFYYEQQEPGAFNRTTPIDEEALTKFNNIPQINRVFDSGNIVIYDVGGLVNAPETP